MEMLGYYNGKFGPLNEMSVPMNDRACFFGDGVYDASYSRNYMIFALDEHIDRFFNSAELLDIKIPHSKAKLKSILNRMVKELDSGDQFVYWQVTRGTGIRKHSFLSEPAPANLWIMLKPADITDLKTKIKLITIEDTRFFHCNIKTLNLIPNVIAAQQTERAGCDEAVFHRGETVTECAHSNVSILKNGVLKTHPLNQYILPGIARAHIIKMCEKHKIPVDETPFSLNELFDADEIIVSSSGSLCLSANEIDGRPVGGRAPELLELLQKSLLEEFLNATNFTLREDERVLSRI